MSRKHGRRLRAAEKTITSVSLDCTASIVIDVAAESKSKRPTFSINAYNGGPVKVGFGRPVVIDLSGLRSRKTIPILLDHDAEQIVGQANEITIERSKVDLTGVVTGDDGPAQKVISHAKNGFQWAASVGVGIDRLESIAENQETNVNGQTFKGPLLVVRSGRLGEVSFVAIGADETASATVAASIAAREMNMTFEQWVKAKGFDPAALTAEQKSFFQSAYDAEFGDDGEEEEAAPPRSRRRKIVAVGENIDNLKLERERQRQISATADNYAGQYPQSLDEIEAARDLALDDVKTSQKDFELSLLRSLRANVDRRSNIRQQVEGFNSDVLEASLCLAGNLANPQKYFKPEVLDVANKRHVGLEEAMLIVARRNGFHGHSLKSSLKEVLFRAFPQIGYDGPEIRASGFSTISIAGILGNVANKFLLQGFYGVDGALPKIAAPKTVTDFKTMTMYRLTGSATAEEVGAGGQLSHGTLGELSYTLAAKTYGKILSVTRQDLINDDLGALTDIPRQLGRGCMTKLNSVGWALLLSNPSSFFHANNNNYTTGATTNLSLSGLEQISTAFSKLTDPNGDPMGIMPRILLVPSELEWIARRLVGSGEIRDNTASVGYGTTNAFTGKYEVVATSYLSNSGISGYSATAYYLLADPQDIAIMNIGYLDGKKEPTIDAADADFSTLGIQLRAFHDFGVAMAEPRGGVKTKGAA